MQKHKRRSLKLIFKITSSKLRAEDSRYINFAISSISSNVKLSILKAKMQSKLSISLHFECVRLTIMQKLNC